MTAQRSAGPITCNGRAYRTPRAPTVVVCLDGSEPGYIEKATAAGRAPTFARFMEKGANYLADSVIPSFTNPNNVSIIAGRPPPRTASPATSSTIGPEPLK